MELLCKCEIAAQRLQHMLPRASSVGVADLQGLAAGEGTHDVGDETIGGPVASADHVAGASRGDGDVMLGVFRGVEEGIAPGTGDDLGAGLRGTVGIVSAERIALAIRPDPLLVLVALVGSDDDDGANGGGLAHGFEQVNGPEDVRLVSADGVGVGVADQRLRGKMEDDLRLRGLHDRGEDGGVAQVADDGVHARGDFGLAEKTRVCGRIERVAGKVRAEMLQPQRKPASLEAGVPGEKNVLACPESACGHGYQTFHGARPLRHRSSRRFLSCIVSMGCQKPSCL